MEPLVLIAYATRYGSTEETARMVGAVLQAHGVPAEVRKVNEISVWKPYSAVILVAALYMGRLHRDARRFLADRRLQLSKLPVALMVPGPVTSAEKDSDGAQKQLDKELARVPWLHPIAQTIVGGKWDPQRLPFPMSWVLRNVPPGDARNWDTIRAWASEVAAKLPSATVS